MVIVVTEVQTIVAVGGLPKAIAVLLQVAGRGNLPLGEAGRLAEMAAVCPPSREMSYQRLTQAPNDLLHVKPIGQSVLNLHCPFIFILGPILFGLGVLNCRVPYLSTVFIHCPVVFIGALTHV